MTLASAPKDRKSRSTSGCSRKMRSRRSGRSVIQPAEAITRLTKAGFSKAYEVARTWQAPLRLVAAWKE